MKRALFLLALVPAVTFAAPSDTAKLVGKGIAPEAAKEIISSISTPDADVTITSGNLAFATATKGVRFSVGTLAAAGSTSANAGLITDRVTTVTAADATKGVILPDAPTAGDLYFIFNTANAVLKIYANSGDTINATANPTAVSVAAYVPTICIATSATQWWCAETTNP